MKNENFERYQRQLLLKEFGIENGSEGQNRLLKSKVLVCGAGGLGSPVLTYLAAAGIGNIGICDSDVLSESNLNRQILYCESDLGKQKALLAKERLEKFNSDVFFETYCERLSEENIESIFRKYDIIVDAVDNFPTRYLINSAAYKNGLPLICGAVCEFDGILTTIVPKEKTACFHCIYPNKPGENITKTVFGILGAIAGTIGVMEALEVIKFILDLNCLKNKLLVFNGINNSFRIKDLQKRNNCPSCSNI
ncbi:MAG: HesA/MoeB/ThiF family protein [Elusimicrobiota bacterium]|jgi:adenylyltransferase/sulfurtransferase|nr:HesA/MoeB/ThiF family protein [Elusimicrobiota bacterium]